MANYTKATDFASKDTLTTGDPAKIVKGTEIDDEFNAIATAVNSKANTASPTLTGTPLAPTAVAGTNTTQIATTAHVYAERTNTATLTNKTLTSPTINTATISGGSVSGITDLAVADGGTGASTASDARANLGVAIGSDVQAYDADLTTLGGLSKTNGNFIVGNGSTWVAESGSTARTSLGLGSIATQNSNSVSITGGSVSGITDLAVADGGTGASNASGARSNLGLGTVSTINTTGSTTTFLRGDGAFATPPYPEVTTSTVLSATAGASVGAVGTYAFLAVESTSTTTGVGSTKAGSGLRYVSTNTTNYPATSPAGTWRCMGYGFKASAVPDGPDQFYGTVWLRIS
jgi:hypothetical protein